MCKCDILKNSLKTIPTCYVFINTCSTTAINIFVTTNYDYNYCPKTDLPSYYLDHDFVLTKKEAFSI